MLKLNLQYFGYSAQTADSLEPTLSLLLGRLKAKGEGGDRGWLDSITDSIHVDVNLSKLQEIVKDRGAWRAPVHTWSQTHVVLNRGCHSVLFLPLSLCSSHFSLIASSSSCTAFCRLVGLFPLSTRYIRVLVEHKFIQHPLPGRLFWTSRLKVCISHTSFSPRGGCILLSGDKNKQKPVNKYHLRT